MISGMFLGEGLLEDLSLSIYSLQASDHVHKSPPDTIFWSSSPGRQIVLFPTAPHDMVTMLQLEAQNRYNPAMTAVITARHPGIVT